MVSMSCCKSGPSLPLDPSGDYLVFLIMLENSTTIVDGIRFYRISRWAPNVLTG